MASVGRPALYPKFKKHLKLYIESSNFKSGDRLDSEAELCNKFGVSRVLIRKAIAELRQDGRIRSVPGKGHFISSPEAKAAEPGVVSAILGFQADDSPYNNPILSSVLKGLEHAFRMTHYRLVWEKTGVMETNVSDLVKPHLEQLRGVVLVPLGGQTGEVMVSHLPANTMFVVAGRPAWSSSIPAVYVDQKAGTKQAMEYLIGLGHRKIGLVTLDEEVGPLVTRHDAYNESLAQAGLGIDPKLSAFCVQGNMHQAEQKIVELIRRNRGELTSLFVASSLLLPMTLRAINSEGLKIKEDISLICYDDNVLAEYNIPAITVLRQPTYEVGKTAGQMLLELMQGKELFPNEIVLYSSLLVRDSCKPVK